MYVLSPLESGKSCFLSSLEGGKSASKDAHFKTFPSRTQVPEPRQLCSAHRMSPSARP
ncbi:hypothetical protein CsSME_00035063 [Camellia sinensis var. sinensis]